MSQRRKQRSPRKLLGALALLLMLVAMLFLSDFFPGLLPGGGRLPSPERDAAKERDPGTLEVTVLSAESRQPVAGASILVQWLRGGRREARSDGEGRVRLVGLGEGPVRVEARFEGRRASAWTDPGTGSAMQLAIAPDPVRRGRVRDAGGAPARATVRLLAKDGTELASTETGADGRYELPDHPHGVAVSAQGEDGATASTPRGDLVLEPGELVEGRLAGAGAGTLQVYGLVVAAKEDAMLPLRAEWRVQPDGTFRGRLPAGAQAWGLFDGRPVRLRSGEVALPDPVTATGVVLQEDGRPAAHAILVFRPLIDEDFPTLLPGPRVEADGEGRFQAPGLSSVRYAIEANAPGCATRIVPEVEPSRGAIEIALAPGYAIEGFVADTGGLPVAEARIQAVGLPERAEHPVLESRADDRGRFHLAGLGGTHARVRVSAPGYHATTLEGVEPAARLQISLQRR